MDRPDLEIYCEWGLDGLSALALFSQALVIVDVLSFCTCVDIAVSRGALIFPFSTSPEIPPAAARRGQNVEDYAQEMDALLAGSRRLRGGYSLSPASLTAIPSGARLVLPSPNGAALSYGATLAGGQAHVFAGCLRNAQAVAAAAAYAASQNISSGYRSPARIGVIPAGERWPSGRLRPALEDLLGAGAIIHALPGRRTPEADQAEASFLHFRPHLAETLHACRSGQELVERGFGDDVALAAGEDVSNSVPILRNGMYYNGARGAADASLSVS